jgi:general secretion pathway protein D
MKELLLVRIQPFTRGVRLTLAMLAMLVAWTAVQAQEPTITPNYRDADIRQIIEAVGEVTGKNFIVDPRVNFKVTMLSSTPMSPDAFYEAFLSILQVNSTVAMENGDIVKIVPDASARQYPGPVSTTSAASDDVVTQVVQVQNVGAAQLVPILRPLIPQYGHLAAHPGSNMLIISDRAANVDRMMRIIRRIDQSSDDEIEVVRLEHASSAEVVRVLTAISQTPRADGAPVTTSLVADARTNSVLVGGDKSERLRLRALIARTAAIPRFATCVTPTQRSYRPSCSSISARPWRRKVVRRRRIRTPRSASGVIHRRTRWSSTHHRR